MEILTLLVEGADFLKKPVPLVNLEAENIREKLSKLSEQMHETRLTYKAVGLAANQCGIPVRMFVMGTGFAQITCVNPEVIEISDETSCIKEGCLSFPNLLMAVKRPSKIKVRYFDVDCNEVVSDLEGIFARCFLHELDHLNGITFDERVSKLSLKMAKDKRAKKTKMR